LLSEKVNIRCLHRKTRLIVPSRHTQGMCPKCLGKVLVIPEQATLLYGKTDPRAIRSIEIAAESLSPERGWVATFIPPLQAKQAGLGAWIDRVALGKGYGDLTPSGPTENRSQPLILQKDARLTTSTRTKSPAAPLPDAALQIAEPGKPERVADRSVRGTSTPPAEPAPDSPADTVVIAEGVGETSDDALRDAFRNAVSQVVGAVVVWRPEDLALVPRRPPRTSQASGEDQERSHG
jgi:hypothetical protein